MRKIIAINIFDALFAFFTSVVQTQRIIRNAKKYNKSNLIWLLCLAGFAAFVSIFQSEVIIKRITKKVQRKFEQDFNDT